MSELGLRYNQGKTRLDLVEPGFIEGLGKVMTYGANKYTVVVDGKEISGADNWRKGLPFKDVLASAKRHLTAIESYEDYDEESGLMHIHHIAANLMMLGEFYHSHPELDNRKKPWETQRKVGLDIDEVLADFGEAYCERYNLDPEFYHWNFDYKVMDRLTELAKDDEFWAKIKPLNKNLKFEPHCYITARPIPAHLTELWLFKNKFPCKPVYSLVVDKAELCTELGLDIFIDDHYKNFVEINKTKTVCYLYTRPHNIKYAVGARRINNLESWKP